MNKPCPVVGACIEVPPFQFILRQKNKRMFPRGIIVGAAVRKTVFGAWLLSKATVRIPTGSFGLRAMMTAE